MKFAVSQFGDNNFNRLKDIDEIFLSPLVLESDKRKEIFTALRQNNVMLGLNIDLDDLDDSDKRWNFGMKLMEAEKEFRECGEKLTAENFHLCNIKLRITKWNPKKDYTKLVTGLCDMNQVFFLQPAKDWATLEKFFKLGVSEVYIGGELCYDFHTLDRMRTKYYPMEFRVIGNIAQGSKLFNEKLDISSFFIRPEDVVFCEGLIDTIELMGENLNTLVKIYCEDKKWEDELSLIISDLESGYNNKYLPSLLPLKMNCKQKCKTRSCDTCYRLESSIHKFVELMEDNKNKN